MPLDLTLLTELDPEALPDAQLRPTVRAVLNVVEALLVEVRALREENQQLKDEINRLKGERGKPTFRPNAPPAAGANYSSESERRQPKAWKKRPKLDRLTISRTEHLAVDRVTLPADAQYRGTESVIVQDLLLVQETVCFRKEVWYSPSQRRSYRAELPAGYEGQFGPGLKALALSLHHGANVTQPKLLELFRQAGVEVSSGWLATLLSADQPVFTTEARAVERAGLASSPWQHSDTTSTRVKGEARHCHVLGNPLYTVYHTLANKDRLAVLDLLRGSHWSGQPRTYLLNADADAYLDWVSFSASARRCLAGFPREQALDEATVTGLLEAQRPWLGPQQRTRVREAMALAAYQAQADWPVVRALVCDDAAAYRLVTDELGLCWIHEGRHYTKLVAHLPLHQRLLADFGDRFWSYYRDLLAYRDHPTSAEAARLAARFDELFATRTGFQLLDDRIRLTRAKKDGLLLVLHHPELPLHNNPAELAARRRVRKRDASFGPRSEAGLNAWDTFMTLAATTQQLGVSFYALLKDRLTSAAQIPPLADIIAERARSLHLGASWTPA
jgi:hypothetical protein